MEKQFIKKEKTPHFDSIKSSNLCYEAVYGPNGVEKNRGRISANYYPFTDYLRLAQKAAELKRNVEAKYFIVDRNNDYKLSTWLTIRVLTKTMNGNPIVYNEITYETLAASGVQLDTVVIDKITLDGKETKFYKIDDYYVVEGATTSKIIVNDDPSLVLQNDLYSPQQVLCDGRTYDVHKNKVSIDNTTSKICEDSQFLFITFKMEKDDNEQKEGEITLELIDDPTQELSVYDVFLQKMLVRYISKILKMTNIVLLIKTKKQAALLLNAMTN